MLKKFLFLLFITLTVDCFSQDPQYSQFLSNPLYLNPGFAGSTEGQRFVVNNRNQWPGIPIAYQTYGASYDVNAQLLNSGFGILLNSDKAGTVGVKSTQVNLIYAYKLTGDNYTLSPAVSFGIGQMSMDYNKLIFGDQLSFNSSQSKPPTLDPALFNLQNVTYFDFNTGVVLYNKASWFGFSVSHLNQPNRSFINTNASYLPMKWSVHGGFKYEIGGTRKYRGYSGNNIKKTYIMPSLIYLKQAQFDQLTLGAMYYKDPINVGLYYRGIPIRQNVSDQMSQDAVVIIVNFKIRTVNIGYSYDITTSKLYGVSGGAHELSIVYTFNNLKIFKYKTTKRAGYIPCPAFHN